MNPLRSLVPTLTLCLAIALVAAPAALADPSGLVAAYGFEEASGTTATDSSGSANTGTLAGPARSASGRFGAALSFDGVNDLVNVADLASLDLTVGMTLEAWVRPGGGGWRTALLKERPGGLAYALYSSSDTNRPMAEIAASSGGETRGTAGLPASTWSHLASTYDGATLRLYVNGTQVSSRAVSGAIALSSGELRIGGNTIWGEYFNGLIDEVRVYNRALTAGEVQLDMGRAVVSASSDTQPPTAPTGLTATVSSDDVHLAWGAAADNVGVTAYRVYRDGSLVTTLGPAATSYDDLDRAPGTYRYTVVAVDGIGLAGPASNEATATIAAPDTVGPTAATLTATLDGNDVHLAWTESTDPSGVKEYRIYRNGTLHRTLPAAERSFDDLDVPSGTRRYSVRAVDNAGNQGPYSNEETVIVPDADAEPPTAPALTAMVTSDDIHLSWTASTDDLGVKEYRLYRDGALISTRTSRDFDDNNRAEGTYRYKVVAVDNAGHTSPDSNEAEATVGPDTSPPTIALASNCDGATVHDYISLRPTFSDDRGPVTVTIKVDGQTIRGPENMGTSGSFFFDWETRGLANGPHVMTAVARDGAGNEAVDECDWIVHNPLVTLPFTSHADGDTVSGTQTFKVQVLGDGEPISRDAMVVRFEATGPVTVGDSSPVYDKEWA